MEKRGSWIAKAEQHLQASLTPVPHELNELDWKETLSKDNERTAQHLSAFANQKGGGFFAFGITPAGQVQGVISEEAHRIVEKLGNLVRDALVHPAISSPTVLEREPVFAIL